jgi:4-hydroxythreonine-4-phosphate dehydrogenase
MSGKGRSRALIPERSKREGTPMSPSTATSEGAARPIVVTMGDAVGIGPEIIVRAFERGALADAVVAGDAAVLRRAGAPMTAVIDAPADLPQVPPGCLPVRRA